MPATETSTCNHGCSSYPPTRMQWEQSKPRALLGNLINQISTGCSTKPQDSPGFVLFKAPCHMEMNLAPEQPWQAARARRLPKGQTDLAAPGRSCLCLQLSTSMVFAGGLLVFNDVSSQTLLEGLWRGKDQECLSIAAKAVQLSFYLEYVIKSQGSGTWEIVKRCDPEPVQGAFPAPLLCPHILPLSS